MTDRTIERKKASKQFVPNKFHEEFENALEGSDRSPELVASAILTLRTELTYNEIGTLLGVQSTSVGVYRKLMKEDFGVPSLEEETAESYVNKVADLCGGGNSVEYQGDRVVMDTYAFKTLVDLLDEGE